MHFMYENDGKSGYVIKGAGTRKPCEYERVGAARAFISKSASQPPMMLGL